VSQEGKLKTTRE